MFATLIWKVKRTEEPGNAVIVNARMRDLLRDRTSIKIIRPGTRLVAIADLSDFNSLVDDLQAIAARYPDNFEFFIILNEAGAIIHGGPNDPHNNPVITQITS